MPPASIGLALLAGMLSTLSPCVLPRLPFVIGSAAAAHPGGALYLAAGVAAAFTIAGLFVATIGFAIGLDGDLFRTISAIMLVVLRLFLLSEPLQSRLGIAVGGISSLGDRGIRRLGLGGGIGQFAVVALLGLVWSPCVGPTLGTASLLAAQRKDLASVAMVMFAFGLGTTLPILAVVTLLRGALNRWRGRMLSAGHLGKAAMGLSAVVVGGMILTGLDRSAEAALVVASPAWLTDLTTQF